MKKSKPHDDVDGHSISDESISSNSSNFDEKKFRKSSKSFVFGSKQQVPAEVSVNVTPERTVSQYDDSTMPQIGKYKYKFRTEILCGALWGVNLLIGTENGLFLLDRSGNGKVFTMVSIF